MQENIAIANARGAGLVFAVHLAELGVTSRDIRHALQNGILVRVRRGVYACPPEDRPFWPSELHTLCVRGTAPLFNPDYVVSHLSAAAMHGLPIIGAWPDSVHVRLPGSPGGSSSPGIVRHRTPFAEEAVVIDGVRVTSLERTLLDVAFTESFAVAVTAMDAALRAGEVSKVSLMESFEGGYRGRGSRGAVECVDFSDSRSESAGESLSRVRVFQLGFQRPELQIPISTLHGRFDVDFGWPAVRRLGEFDGYVKYTRGAYLRGRSIEDVVMEEKVREDAIRAKTGDTFLRWLWSDALNAGSFERMLRDVGIPAARDSSLASWVGRV